MQKVKEINLERGYPTVDAAISTMKNELATGKRVGLRAVILIHGYGSTGDGGAIKQAVKSKISSPDLRGIVQMFCAGEDWVSKKKEILNICPALKEYSNKIEGNLGMSIVILKK